jgi:hypothetical protein
LTGQPFTVAEPVGRSTALQRRRFRFQCRHACLYWPHLEARPPDLV